MRSISLFSLQGKVIDRRKTFLLSLKISIIITEKKKLYAQYSLRKTESICVSSTSQVFNSNLT